LKFKDLKIITPAEFAKKWREEKLERKRGRNVFDKEVVSHY
jgi:hypothetical protein